MTAMPRLRADFNGVFGDLLCLSHGDHSYDEAGNKETRLPEDVSSFWTICTDLVQA